MNDEYILEMERIEKGFFGVQVLHGVDLRVRPGEVHALLGENGAGKSTLMKILCGIHRADSGVIRLAGRQPLIDSPLAARRQGVSIMHQEICMAGNMTIAENIFLGAELTRHRGLSVDMAEMLRRAQEMLDLFGLGLRADQEIGSLRIAQQQMVEIVRALSFQARIIVMDEPTSSLTDREIRVLFAQIRRLREQGVAVIYISHKLEEIFEICDRVTVLRDGRHIGTKAVADTDNADLIRMMVGREISDLYAARRPVAGKVALEARDLCNPHLHNVSFTLREGEILGFAGLVGAGRTELARALVGVDSLEQGEILLDGEPVDIRSPRCAIRNGIALVPEDRKKQGLFLRHSVAYNLTLAVADRFTGWMLHNRRREQEIIDTYAGRLSIKMSGPDQLCINLSGGNQQKVVISKWLATGSRVLILDEPTRGVDVGAKAEIYHLIGELAGAGLAVIVISSELPEVMNLSSRIAVMCEGRIAAVLDAAHGEVTQEKIMHYATGGN